ncbi:MAG: hypothetical protein M1829_002965 [Trizodia sp. TS-e1964]|nr:MAG: hypothetical protein M1829_002965 [Trizodia sp. TS-e1964]
MGNVAPAPLRARAHSLQQFMDAIAAECSVQQHHPEWSNVYNTAFVRWTTHRPAGLSAKDIAMARFCDAQAMLLGEVAGPETDNGDGMSELADESARLGGGCCAPK